MIALQIAKAVLSSVSSVVSPGDKVAVLTDWKVDELIPKTVCETIVALGGEPCLMSYQPVTAFGNEPPDFLVNSVVEQNAVIACTSTALTHTNLIRSSLERGVKYLGMAGLDVDMFRQGACLADYENLYTFTKALSSLVEKTETVHITSAAGTDMTFKITNRPAFCLAGRITETDKVAAFPDGEVACAPVEGTANGTVVVDGSMHGVGNCKEPINIQFKEGLAVSISGGTEAIQLKRLIENAGDKNSFNLAEFAIGTNPMARVVGSLQEDKKALGTIHIAIGDNHTLGGLIKSKTHLDGVVLNPSVWLDDTLLLDQGEVLWGDL